MNQLIPALAVATLAAAPAFAQQGSARSLVDLELPTIVPGAAAEFTLRSTEIGAPARILIGTATVNPLATPSGVLLVDASPGAVLAGTVGPDGRFSRTITLPAVINAAKVAVQGGILVTGGRAILSDRENLLVNPAKDPVFTGGSLTLPVGASRESGEPVAVDLDRDGDHDLIISGVGGLAIYMNVGGTLVDETATRIPAADNDTCFRVDAADFDADGHLDLLVSGRLDALDQPLAAIILHNDGSGFFGAAVGRIDLPLAIEAHAIAAIGDVDSDSDLDILLTDGGYHSGGVGPQTISLLLDQGGLQGGVAGSYLEDGGFASATFNLDPEAAAGIDLGDVDNDGDLDVAVARANGSKNQLLLNDGSGGFTDASANLPDFFDRSSDAEFADLDGDGFLDLIFMNSHVSTPPASSGDVLYNKGAAQPGVFEDGGSRFPDTFDEDLQIRLFSLTGDVDGDGDLDLFILPHEFFGTLAPFVGQPTLFVNQGNAQGGVEGEFVKDSDFFRSGGTPLETYVSAGGTLLDLDGDGDLEFFGTSTGGIINPLKTDAFLLGNQTF